MVSIDKDQVRLREISKSCDDNIRMKDTFRQSEKDRDRERVLDDSPWQNPDYFDSVFKEYMFVGCGMIAQLLNQACATLTLPIMNILSERLSAEPSSQTWLMASFPLVSGSFILVSGRAGDVYGLKRTLLSGYVVLIVWSLICGLSNYANTGTFFIISRALQGLGMSFILPNLLGTVGRVYKPQTHRKNIVISLIGMCAPIGAFLGTLFSGLIVETSEGDWPWSFYAFVIAASFNFILSYFCIPNNISTNVHHFSMDWVGCLSGVSGLLLFNFVWNQAPIVGWDVGYIIALLIVSVFLLTGFFIYELKICKNPLLPREVSCNRSILMILAAVLLGWGSFGIWSFYYFQFSLNLRNYSPLGAAATYVTFAVWGVVAALTVGFLIKPLGPAIILFLSLIAFVCGSALLSVAPVHESYFRLTFGAMTILSFGLDMSFPAASIILSDELPQQYQGMAGSLANTVVNYSMSLFLGIGSTIEQNILKRGSSQLQGYRAALYFAVGCASLGLLISGIFVLDRLTVRRSRKTAGLT